MFHGYGSYVGKFAYIGEKIAEQGFDFVGFDYRGFGKSEGVRGLISTDIFIKDAVSFVEKVKEFYKT